MTTFQIILSVASVAAIVGFCYWTYRIGRKPTVEEWLMSPIDFREFDALTSLGFHIEKEAAFGLYIASHDKFHINVVGRSDGLTYEALVSALALLATYVKEKKERMDKAGR